jgi:tRNA (guanine37-N1)-methyltransferase
MGEKSMTWNIRILTLFPELYPGPLGISIFQRAANTGVFSLDVKNIRDFATDKHKTVDDTIYGGGAGLLIKPDVLANAIDSFFLPENRIVYLSPKGRVFNQEIARDFVAYQGGINLICGRYEGIDERLFFEYKIETISMGDYVVSAGDTVAFPFLDCCLRLLILSQEATLDESFSGNEARRYLLEHPHYTKPSLWRGHGVPEVLLSGNHAEIEKWRLESAEQLTKNARPDLWDQYIKEKNK